MTIKQSYAIIKLQNENFNFHNHKKTLLYFFNNYEKDINDIKNDMKDMLNVFILNNLFNVNETENINKNINNFVNIFAPKNPQTAAQTIRLLINSCGRTVTSTIFGVGSFAFSFSLYSQ